MGQVFIGVTLVVAGIAAFIEAHRMECWRYRRESGAS
jgi:hypothetical protein